MTADQKHGILDVLTPIWVGEDRVGTPPPLYAVLPGYLCSVRRFNVWMVEVRRGTGSPKTPLEIVETTAHAGLEANQSYPEC